jgi:hypothetical protein
MEGENYAWMRLAFRMKKSPQRCQDEFTSTEFIMANKFLDEEEWHTHDKNSYQLARVAWEVAKVGMMISGGKMPPLEEFLVEFKRREEEKPPDPTSVEGLDFETGGGKPGIEIGEPLDEKWQKVNDEAKAEWAALLTAQGADWHWTS